MATLDITDSQVLELIRQLPSDARSEALRRLLADGDWDVLLAYGQARLADQLRQRGLEPSDMSPDEIEAVIERIADGE